MQKNMFIKDQIYDTVKRFCMACGVNSVKIKSLKEKNTKHEQETWALITGVTEESAFSVDRSHFRRVLFVVIGKNGKHRKT